MEDSVPDGICIDITFNHGRRLRNFTNQLINELQSNSDFFDNASVFTLVDKIKCIPDLVLNLRKYMECWEDLDYDLGVEPLLSNRVPWGVKQPGARSLLDRG